MSVRGQQISHFNFSFNFKHCKQQKVFLVKNEFIFIWKKKKEQRLCSHFLFACCSGYKAAHRIILIAVCKLNIKKTIK